MKLQISKKLPIILAGVILILLTTMILGITAQAKEATAEKAAKEKVAASQVLHDEAVATAVDENGAMIIESEETDQNTGSKAWAAAIAVGLAAAAGAIGMGLAIGKSAEGISRQPEAEGKIRTTLMLGLVFIETAIIYALIVAILIIFVM